MELPAPGLFVTGTDTGVGKTLIACALLRALAARGVAALGMKPIASGCVGTPEGLRSDDAERLRGASARRLSYARINPYAFAPPIAPHLAAQAAGVEIAITAIVAHFRTLARESPCIVVEGVGGFEVPITEVETTADLAATLALPVILVVGLRLGCLSHALLTAQAIRARGLPFAGWVANGIDPGMERLQDNVDALRARLPGPLLGVVPPLAAPDPEAVAQRLDVTPLL